MRECFDVKHGFDDPSDDITGDWQECEQVTAGDDGELSGKYRAVIDCAVALYVAPSEGAGEDDYNRLDGDSICTGACFDLFTLEP